MEFCQIKGYFVCLSPKFPDSKDQDTVLFSARFPNFSKEPKVSAKSEIVTGKNCLSCHRKRNWEKNKF